MEEQLVIKVEDNELSLKRVKKEATEAERRGVKVGYNLTGIKDNAMKRDIIMYLNE
ncbi:hypothetical protein QGM71_20785 [Virgibacillus sp. C22-A2]|uniref:Uncharacterized protein n=1 Tax=Virgibacillus tibetensis TaxID=3042313 RepID=A0ABU6KKS1_9BACI|nr:hypothetical protein [Virgibacillus sp. C22-A2]